jgi:hypothetical protein
MQRALSYDHHDGVVVFEAPAGQPVRELEAERLKPRILARLLKRLARALAPLHERGVGHGSINSTTVLCDESFNPTILTCGHEPPASPPSPEGDTAAVIGLIANAIGAKPTDSGLLKAIAPALSHPEAVAILVHGAPDDAESLFRFADAAEIAALKIWRAGWK